jgi:hypothetical protein
MALWELQIDSSTAAGWKGWRVKLTAGEVKELFAFDERDEVERPDQAVAMALETDKAQPIIATGDFTVSITEIRTVISAEVNPN